MLTTTRFLSSSIGAKLLVAVTGLSLLGFLILHLLGNTFVFLGPSTFNEYSHKLISNPLVVPAEIGLLIIFMLHGVATVFTWASNRAARPIPYVVTRSAGLPSRRTLASQTMIVTGPLVLCFLLVHIKTLKLGPWYTVAETGFRDLYRLEMELLGQPSTLAFYVVSMLVIGLHLWHASSSALESLGINHPRITPILMFLARVVAVILAALFTGVAVGVHLGGAL